MIDNINDKYPPVEKIGTLKVIEQRKVYANLLHTRKIITKYRKYGFFIDFKSYGYTSCLN